MPVSAENIHIFNTLTRKRERFTPIEKGRVKMYTCGPTVYDFAHIGNFRTFIFEDLLRRWLEYRGFNVVQVMNLTDVDDRTITASRKNKIPLKDYTERYIQAFFADATALNIKKAEYYPRATEHIAEMVALIKKLIEKGYAYRGEDNSVYYKISKFSNYGKLSRINVKELKAGARVKVDEYGKEEAQDFALWKSWDEADGDIFWETELGKGRPGWHIECSAMSMKYLGETFDIHTGGIDNIFPHHENEIAQSEAATDREFVDYWLHSEHLLVDGKRMAKRHGNYYTTDDLITRMGHDPRAIRYLLLSTHYRQQLNFTFSGLEAAKNAVERLTNFMYRLIDANGKGCKEEIAQLVDHVRRSFNEAMDDDLNISVALAALFDFVREVNSLIGSNKLSKKEARKVYRLMRGFDKVLGVIGEVKRGRLPRSAKELIKVREEARRCGDWKTANQIRVQLRSMGVLVEDTAEGPTWRIVKH